MTDAALISAEKQYPVAPVRLAWLASHDEVALEPQLLIIDAHHHLWDRRQSTYLKPEFVSDVSSGHNIRATVYVEGRSKYRQDGDPVLRSVGETEFAASVAESCTDGDARLCAGIVAYADLRLDATIGKVLDAHQELSKGRLRGIRNISAWHLEQELIGGQGPPPQLLSSDEFRRGFAVLAGRNLSFDAWMFHPQLIELESLADAFPDTTIVLNHLGGPLGMGSYATKKGDVFVAWKAALVRLAQRPNIVLKIGGLGMPLLGFSFHRMPMAPSSELLALSWAPYVEAAIDVFGVTRCMFESNFPVDKGTCSYVVLWNAFKRITAGYSAHEREQLFSRTAASSYRLMM